MVVYVCEAGTPGISDPGYRLVKAAIAASIAVIPVPGPSAVIAALSISGLPMNTFRFLGFPPSQHSKRIKYFLSLKDERSTMVFYESPKRALASLTDIREVFGNRNAVLARELTKIHEEVIRGTLDEILSGLINFGTELKGEITFVVGGNESQIAQLTDEEIIERARELQGQGLSTRDAARMIAEESGVNRNKIYKAILFSRQHQP